LEVGPLDEKKVPNERNLRNHIINISKRLKRMKGKMKKRKKKMRRSLAKNLPLRNNY